MKGLTIKDIEDALNEVFKKKDEADRKFEEWFMEACRRNPEFTKEVARVMAQEIYQVNKESIQFPIVIDTERVKQYLKYKLPNGVSITLKDEVYEKT